MALLGTVQNVGRVLDLYDQEHVDRGPTEVAQLLGMGRSKVQVLMASMAEVGLLRRTPRGRYTIGWRALQLERLITGHAPFRPIARAMALRLARDSGEVVHVAALDAGRVVYVDRIEGARAAEIPVSSVGAVLPAHCSGVGKTLLAHLPPSEIDLVLDTHGLPRFTDATICDRDALYAELHRIRRDGVAFDREEVQAGLACVAAPIVGADGDVVAAMSISSPVDRMRTGEANYRALIVGATARVTRELRATSPTM